MPADHTKASRFIARLAGQRAPATWPARAVPLDDDPSPRSPRATQITPQALDHRWSVLAKPDAVRAELLDPYTMAQMGEYEANIESFVGTVKVPVGIAGPMRLRGLFARGDFYVPLATTEAALVASYTRGMQAINDADGAIVAVINQGVSRAPAFLFPSLVEAGKFTVWCGEHLDEVRTVAQSTTSHGTLDEVRFSIEGNHVYIVFEYLTEDAAGQNMVTIATDAACRWIVEHCPVRPERWYVEANHSGDKKATYQSFLGVRGRKVVAEARLPAAVIKRRFHTTAGEMEQCWRVSAIGGVISGSIGIQGHIANGLAAIYIACGQDAACVAESSVGVTRFETTSDGGLYASITLPNLIVGTVGGGTKLPSQRACLDVLGLAGAGNANAFAEVCAGLALAGELSIIAALASGQFSEAHRSLARDRTAGG